MLTTTNYGLKKPEGTDVVNIEDLNYNADVIDKKMADKVDKVSGKGLSTNDFTSDYKTKLDGITNGATKVQKSNTNGNVIINGTETTVYTHPSGTNPHGTTKSDVGLGNVNNWGASAATNNSSDTTYATAGAVKKAYDRVETLIGKPNGIAGLNEDGKIDSAYLDDSSSIKFTRLPSIGDTGGSYSNVTINNYIEIFFHTYSKGTKIYFNDTLLFSNTNLYDRCMGKIIIDKNGNCYIGYDYLDYSDYPEGYEVIDLLMKIFAPNTQKTVSVSSLNTISITGDTYNRIQAEVVSW